MESVKQNKHAVDPAPALGRGLELLQLLHRQGACSLEQIALESGWPKSSVLRLLQCLMSHGTVGRDPDTLAYRALQHLVPIDSVDQQLRNHCAAAMAKLCEQSGHTVELYRIDPGGAEMIDRQEPRDAVVCVVARVGWRRTPEEFEATNQVRTAFGAQEPQPASGLWHWNAGKKALLTQEAFTRVITQVRKSGYAVDLDVNSNGVRRYAAPITESDARLRAILTIAQACTLHNHSTNAKFGQQLAAMAQSLSESLSLGRR